MIEQILYVWKKTYYSKQRWHVAADFLNAVPQHAVICNTHTKSALILVSLSSDNGQCKNIFQNNDYSTIPNVCPHLMYLHTFETRFWLPNVHIPAWNTLLCTIFGQKMDSFWSSMLECLRLTAKFSCHKYSMWIH
jgi:hypothetical protein